MPCGCGPTCAGRASQGRARRGSRLQVLAWAGGSALWIAVTFIGWLIRGREDRPQPVAELLGDTSRQKLTRPLIMFAVIRALVIAGTVALAFGLNLSHGYWMPIAAMIAMKPSLQQATLVAVQRLSGALIGAAAAALLLLLIPANEHGLRLFAIERGLEVFALVLSMHGAAIRFWNYALYCGAWRPSAAAASVCLEEAAAR
jgi:Fusaric acid resistance protein-like